jgi:hypothetical protein
MATTDCIVRLIIYGGGIKILTARIKKPNGEDCYWSRGNGWVFVAFARTLTDLPKTDPHYNEYLQDFKDMADALLKIQRSDGFWNVSLHDSTDFGERKQQVPACLCMDLHGALIIRFLMRINSNLQ